MFRKVRIAFSVVCGLVCLLTIVLWMRSYRAEDRASCRLSSVGIRLYSSRGWLVLFKNSTPGAGPYDWDITLGSDYWLNPPDARLQYALPPSFFLADLPSRTFRFPTGLSRWRVSPSPPLRGYATGNSASASALC